MAPTPLSDILLENIALGETLLGPVLYRRMTGPKRLRYYAGLPDMNYKDDE
jgi:hypothetical protein